MPMEDARGRLVKDYKSLMALELFQTLVAKHLPLIRPTKPEWSLFCDLYLKREES